MIRSDRGRASGFYPLTQPQGLAINSAGTAAAPVASVLRPSSGPGRETVHDVGNYSVQTLDKLVVRLVREELARRS